MKGSDPGDVVLLFGGSSGERHVSVASAQHIAALLADAAPWFVAPDGAVYACDRAALLAHARPFETDFVPAGPPLAADLASALHGARGRDPVFLLGLHGGSGEDGTVQRLLESEGLAFTGSGSAASARAFDKSVARRVAREHGVATAEAVILPRGDVSAVRRALAALLSAHGRCVAKPVADGSSVGLFHVRGAADLDAAARDIEAMPPHVAYLAEAFVTGPELTVGVVDGPAGARALPVSEVRLSPGHAFDFEGKYLGRGTTEITPAEVPLEVSGAAQALALTMHAALGCEGYTRTDIIASPAGVVFLETNTLPGMTRASFIPQQLAAEGTPIPDFLAGQLQRARARQRTR